MQIDYATLTSQRQIPRVLYGAEGSVVSFWILRNTLLMSIQNIQDGGWNILGKQLKSTQDVSTAGL